MVNPSGNLASQVTLSKKRLLTLATPGSKKQKILPGDFNAKSYAALNKRWVNPNLYWVNPKLIMPKGMLANTVLKQLQSAGLQTHN